MEIDLSDLTERQKGLLADNGMPIYLSHYTQLPYLLKILNEKKLKLSDTEGFKDPVDRGWTRSYKEKKGTTKLFIICFTWETELINHWQTYAKGKFGCYLSFDAPKLIEAAAQQGIKCGFIRYRKRIASKSPEETPAEEIPFSKAWAYRSEYEYRFVSDEKSYLTFDTSWVKQISITAKMDNDSFGYF